jgi:hypothetical protein
MVKNDPGLKKGNKSQPVEIYAQRTHKHLS